MAGIGRNEGKGRWNRSRLRRDRATPTRATIGTCAWVTDRHRVDGQLQRDLRKSLMNSRSRPRFMSVVTSYGRRGRGRGGAGEHQSPHRDPLNRHRKNIATGPVPAVPWLIRLMHTDCNCIDDAVGFGYWRGYARRCLQFAGDEWMAGCWCWRAVRGEEPRDAGAGCRDVQRGLSA